MPKRPSPYEWIPPTTPDDYVKCVVCNAGWLRQHAIEVGGELFCSNECCQERAIDLLLKEETNESK